MKSKAYWLITPIVPIGLLAGLWQFGVLKTTFETQIVLASGKATRSVSGQGSTPLAAVRRAEEAGNQFIQEALNKDKSSLQKKIDDLNKAKAGLTVKLEGLHQERQRTIKGGGSVRLPADWNTKLNAMKTRRAMLMERYPTHTDIQVLGKQIQEMENMRKRQSSNAATRVVDLGRQIAETQTELRFNARKTQALTDAFKKVKFTWQVTQPAATPRWPARTSGVPVSTGVAVLGFLLCAFVLKTRSGKPKEAQHDVIALSLLMPDKQNEFAETSSAVPDDPISRKAAAFYDRWLDIVKKVYTPSGEPPRQIFESAQPLLKETMAFMGEGHDALTRHVARTVMAGDLTSHVTRTVLMALLGAHEAGVSQEHQQGMTFAAMFHDLSMVPRADNGWQDVGNEVGRLSSSFVRKIPGLPPQLLNMVEAMLISMDEHDLKVWQNVARDANMEPFAKLLRQIDRFDKVAQKQKSRLTRRINSAAA